MTEVQQRESERSEFEKATVASIDDADIEKDRAAIGKDSAMSSQEWVSTATPEAIRNFAYGYGDDNPLFCDPAHGAGSRWGSQVAPQIMAAVLNAPMLGDKLPREFRGGSYRGIHAYVSGCTWDWYRPIYPGDTLYSFTGLESITEKPSEYAGRTLIKIDREVKINQRAEVVGVYRRLMILAERKKSKENRKYSDIPPPVYTDDDIAKLDQIYAAEQVRGAEPRYWEDVEVGDSLGPMAKGPLTTTDIVVFHAGGYGFVPYGLKTGRMAYQNRVRIAPFYIKNSYGVPDVAQRIHWDNEWAQAIGNPRAYDYGVLRECWLHHLLSDWMGDAGWIVRQHDEVRKFNFQGDYQILRGTVTGKRIEDAQTLVDVEFTATNQRDEESARGDAVISLPSREHGPVLLPQVPPPLARRAVTMMERHGELLREGHTPAPSSGRRTG
jgi:acyl dehydratase